MSFAAIIQESVRALGRRAMGVIGGMGSAAIFLAESIRWLFAPPWRFSLLTRQIYIIGAGSLSIVLLTGLFTGMVLALQGITPSENSAPKPFWAPPSPSASSGSSGPCSPRSSSPEGRAPP